MIALLLALHVSPPDPNLPTHVVDDIEINTVVAWNAEDVKYDVTLTQLIAWGDRDQGYGHTRTCLDWLMLDRKKNDEPIVPHFNVERDGRIRMVIEHRGYQHVIVARRLHSTITDYDPELAHRRSFGDNEGLWND